MNGNAALDGLIDNAFALIDRGYYNACTHRPVVERRRPLSFALDQNTRFPIIAEVKVASPADGPLSSHSASDLVQSYVRGGAAALSILTEPNHFAGDLRYLQLVEDETVPVLMKDFVVDERQVRTAHRFRASAVLLIQEVFSLRPELDRDELIDLAHQMGLEVLLEAHTRSGLKTVQESEADLIGINQRDLGTMAIDRSTGLRLLPLVKDDPRHITVMSGVSTKDEVVALRSAGADAVLVGKCLSSSLDPVAALRSLEVDR